MEKGREIVLYAAASVAGNMLGASLHLHPAIYLTAAALAAFATLRTPGPSRRFHLAACAAFLLLGAASVQIYRIPACSPGAEFRRRCLEIRGICSGALDSRLPEGDERAVIKAVVLGDKSEISPALRRQYAGSGAAHLLALSGLHIGMVWKIFMAALFFLGCTPAARRLKTLIVLPALWGYACITGLSPSVTRAAAMITVHEIARLRRASPSGMNSLAIAAMLILTISPESLREAGFQLSFSACLGIFLIHPHLKKLLDARSLPLKYVWNTLSLSISCQMTAGVVSWLWFGTFPKYFMLTNLLSLPVASAILCFSTFGAFGILFPKIVKNSFSLVRWATWLLNAIVGHIADL